MPKIITAHTGVKHITSDDVGALHQAIIGSNDYLLSDNPEDFKAVMLNADTIQMPEAEVVVQGTHIRILNTDKVQIETGQNGLKRIDIIAVCYEKSENGVETAELKVVKGEASTAPVTPLLVQSDIRNGGLYHEMPLFRVDINGVSIETVTSACETIKSLYSIFHMLSKQSESIKGLNNKTAQLEEKTKAIDSNAEAIQIINTNNLLWSGSYYMNENNVVNLSKPISEQTKGIALVWLPMSSDNKKENVQYQLILKDSVSLLSDTTHTVFLCNTAFTKVACKSVYVTDNTIKGNVYNTQQGQKNGIIFNNADYVLRYVIGF